MLRRLALLIALSLGLSLPALAQTETSLNNFGSAPVYLITSPSNGQCLTYQSSTQKWINGSCSGGGGSGTVTSVALSIPSLFTISGSPVTTTGTLTATPAGTSGGIPYFSSATVLASSAALTANALVLGGGAGGTPTVAASLGTTSQVLHGNAAGAPTFGAIASGDLTSALTTPSAIGGVTPAAGAFTTLGSTLLASLASGLTQASNTSVDGLTLIDSTVAPSTGNQQFSPRIRLTGSGWKTTATAGPETVDWIIENQPVQGTTTPNTSLVFARQINAAGFLNSLSLGSSAISFSNTTDNASITLQGTGQVLAPQFVPSAISSGSTNSFYASASNTLAFKANSTVTMTMTSTTVNLPAIASSSAATTGTVCWTTGTGSLTVDTTVACLASTKRVKQNIQPLDVGLAEVMKLRPVSYDLKPQFNPKGLGPQVGLVAEEVQAIDPRLVGLDTSGQPMGVRYMQTTALLIKAIQEQQQEIRVLERQVRSQHKRTR